MYGNTNKTKTMNNSGLSNVGNKFDQSQWNLIEKTVSPFEKQVIASQINTGITYSMGNATKSIVQTNKKYCLGEKFDALICEKLFHYIIRFL